MEELCDLAVVIPSSLDVKNWDGSVIFEEKPVSVIPYADASTAEQPSREDVMVEISDVLANFCTAAAAIQSNGLCRDSFTALSVCKIVWY